MLLLILSIILYVLSAVWIFYRVVIEKEFLGFTWRDGHFRSVFRRDDETTL